MRGIEFHRDRNNFGYTNGQIFFNNKCNNNLIISDECCTNISDLQDSFVIIKNGEIEKYPISDFNYISQEVERILYGKVPKYYKSLMVREKENLIPKNLEQLSKEVSLNYELKVNYIKRIERTDRGDGVFYIMDQNGQEYVLKHYGMNKDKLNLLGYLTNSLEDIFPKISLTTEKEYALKMDDGYYGLEKFIRGSIMPRDSKYFMDVGEHMSLMHIKLNEWLERHMEIKSAIHSNAGAISDSNILSLWIDMTLSGLYSERKEVEKIAKSNLRERVFKSSESFIHADLNNANIIWTDFGPKFIDIETIKYSRRILDFEGTLLFRGNMLPPEYVPSSVENLFRGYNKEAQLSIQDEEREVIGELMIYSLLKNFVVRNLRRGENKNSIERLWKNISNIRKDC